MKCHNESLFSLQKMNRFNIIYFKLSMHKKLIYNKIEHVQPDKDVMLIKKKKDKAVVLKWNIGAPRQNKAQVLWRGSYHQVIYLGQKLSSFIKNIWFFFVCVYTVIQITIYFSKTRNYSEYLSLVDRNRSLKIQFN